MFDIIKMSTIYSDVLCKYRKRNSLAVKLTCDLLDVCCDKVRCTVHSRNYDGMLLETGKIL